MSFERLRERREELGLRLEDVAEALRIPPTHLRSIEEGRLDRLPSGPYRRGWPRAYCAHLGLDPADFVPAGPDRPEPPRRVPTAAIRGMAAGACIAMALMLAWQLQPEATPPAEVAAVPPPPVEPDQRVRVRVQRPGHLRLVVDGEQVLDRRVRPGEEVEVAGHDRVEVHLPAAEIARVEYNGAPVVPQGRQDVPRRLVFIDDLEE